MDVSIEELDAFAERFAAELPEKAAPQAHIVGLRGELGAGKTTFVQRLAKALGAIKTPVSPTFVIAQSYPISRAPFSRLIHIDAYRLSPDEADTVGWADYARDPKNLIVVEWPERLPWFPKDAPLLSFAVKSPTVRSIAHEKN